MTFPPTLLLWGALALPQTPAVQDAALPRAARPARPPRPPVAEALVPERPNLLVVLLDDAGVETIPGYGLPVQGGHGPTPVIDALIDVGTHFRNAYASPVCSPTRLAILTGEYPHRYGVGVSINYAACQPELTPPVDGSYEHLPALLAGAGYRTAAVGKWHMANQCNGEMTHPLLVGYETHRGPVNNIADFSSWEKYVDGVSVGVTTTYATTDTADEAIAVIEAFGDEPWFVYTAFNAPHKPFHVPPAALRSLEVDEDSSDNLKHRAMLEALDTELGRILSAIRPAVLERTIVVVMGDNGTPPTAVIDDDYLPAKGTTFEGGVHVPLVFAGAGIPEGEARTGLVQAPDLFATLLKLGGVEPPARDGLSYAAHLVGRAPDSPREMVYVHRNKPNGPAPWFDADHRAARDRRYKIRRNENVGTMQVFDLIFDPNEDFPLPLVALPPDAQESVSALRQFINGLH